MIRADALRVVFGRTVALDSVTFEIGPGVTGLFGPNGSGKSTFLRAAAGLLRPVGGAVSIDGVVATMRSERFRRRIGYAGHQSGLYPDLSVAENLTLFGRLYGARPDRVEEMLTAVGLTDRASTPVGALSAGLARRASVARAMLHEPDVLLLDEPYANLDDEAAAKISEAVKAWVAPGRCAVIATHGAKRVKAFADAGVILRDGRVVIEGSYRNPARATAR
ncbi:MAG TPA: heme ABC exporter ATP-binding protein CcmA [Actinomycetota bacterium]|nr:heme ABC exporter ATP-binding protein CcmA [Actinomycetota bacterium]